MVWFFSRSKKGRIPPPKVRKKLLAVQGNHYHLQEMYDELNQTYFENQIVAKITWFGSKERKAKVHRLLGLYDFEEKLIKIHRLLDTPLFPPYFVSYVIYHEMLHERFPPVGVRKRRRRVHHADFKQQEQLFFHFLEAKRWEKANKQLFFSPGIT